MVEYGAAHTTLSRCLYMCSSYCIVVDWVGQDARSGLFVGVNRTDRGQWTTVAASGSRKSGHGAATCQRKLFVAISICDSVCIWALVKIIFKEVRRGIWAQTDCV